MTETERETPIPSFPSLSPSASPTARIKPSTTQDELHSILLYSMYRPIKPGSDDGRARTDQDAWEAYQQAQQKHKVLERKDVAPTEPVTILPYTPPSACRPRALHYTDLARQHHFESSPPPVIERLTRPGTTHGARMRQPKPRPVIPPNIVIPEKLDLTWLEESDGTTTSIGEDKYDTPTSTSIDVRSLVSSIMNVDPLNSTPSARPFNDQHYTYEQLLNGQQTSIHAHVKQIHVTSQHHSHATHHTKGTTGSSHR